MVICNSIYIYVLCQHFKGHNHVLSTIKCIKYIIRFCLINILFIKVVLSQIGTLIKIDGKSKIFMNQN